MLATPDLKTSALDRRCRYSVNEAVLPADKVVVVVVTARPGRVDRALNIDLPRPRGLVARKAPEFARLVDEITQEFLARGVLDDSRTRSLLGQRGAQIPPVNQATNTWLAGMHKGSEARAIPVRSNREVLPPQRHAGLSGLACGAGWGGSGKVRAAARA